MVEDLIAADNPATNNMNILIYQQQGNAIDFGDLLLTSFLESALLLQELVALLMGGDAGGNGQTEI